MTKNNNSQNNTINPKNKVVKVNNKSKVPLSDITSMILNNIKNAKSRIQNRNKTFDTK